MNEQDNHGLLLYKYTAGMKMTRRERKELHSWLSRHQHLLDFSFSPERLREQAKGRQQADASWQAFKNKYDSVIDLDEDIVLEPPAIQKAPVVVRIMKYAAILAVLAAGAWFLLKQRPPRQAAVVVDAGRPAGIHPGGFKATLRLGDSSTIGLGAGGKGTVAIQGNTSIMQQEEGQLEYKTGLANVESVSVYMNELATPRGGKYQLTLPDGSKVQLNAASVLRYPTSFNGRERMVELLSGEAFFTVTKNRSKPFRVKLNDGHTIEVTGTQFDINTYGDEKTNKTTLVEGKITITGTSAEGEGTWEVKPYQQALTNSAGNIRVSPADTAAVLQAMAWTTGSFTFNQVELTLVMKQLERWYDMTVEYRAPLNNRIIAIRNMPMNSNISEVLDVLKGLTPFNYSIAGKKVILSE